MLSLQPDRLPYVGVSEVESTAAGVVLHRLPTWARTQTADPLLQFVESMPAGVRISMQTDAPFLELNVSLTLLQLGDKEPLSASFDVVIDGSLTQTVQSNEGTRLVMRPGIGPELIPGAASTIRLDLPGDIARRIEVWLPHAAGLALIGARIPDGHTFGASSDHLPRWVRSGSSISHCLEATSPARTWPALVAREAGLDLQNLGLAGQCMLDPFVAGTIRDLPADLISMKVGINILNGDTFRERTFVPALHGFLDTIRHRHPDTPLLVITPIIFPAGEDAPRAEHTTARRDVRRGSPN